MPALLIALIPLFISILKPVKNEAKKVDEGRTSKTLLILIACFAVYYIVSSWNKSKKQTYLDTAGTDRNTQQAQALRDAMNRSGISYLMPLDGTDVELILQTAAQITDYAGVSDSYRTLYSSELTTDLQGELSRVDLQKFYDIVNRATPGTQTTTPGQTVTPTGITSAVGKTVTATQAVNVRAFTKPALVDHQAKKGDVIGTYISEKIIPDVPAKGNRILFVQVRTKVVFGLYDVDYWVSKGSLSIK